VPAALVAWLAATAFAVTALARFDAAPGPAATAPVEWPDASRVTRTSGRPTLVVFLHPRCPCSNATIAELDRLLARRRDRCDLRVLEVAPPGAPDGWTRTPGRARAAAVPGARVEDDVDGLEARRFGATTSGDVRLYDGAGRLRFAGGVTASRGHEGGAPGLSALAAVLDGDVSARRSTAPVFGCPLFTPEPASTKRDEADVSEGAAR
jgi:hypothetical protein